MQTLIIFVFIFLPLASLASLIAAFVVKAKYKAWMNSINATGLIKRIEQESRKTARLYLAVRASGSDIAVELTMPAKRVKAQNLEIGSYLPLFLDEKANAAENREYLKGKYKSCFTLSWILFFALCLAFLLYVESFAPKDYR